VKGREYNNVTDEIKEKVRIGLDDFIKMQISF
jgi:hypothetical protein